jgi:hypothetical protein
MATRSGRGDPTAPYPGLKFYKELDCGSYMMVIMDPAHQWHQPRGDSMRTAIANMMCDPSPSLATTAVAERFRTNRRRNKPVKWKDLPEVWKREFRYFMRDWGSPRSTSGFAGTAEFVDAQEMHKLHPRTFWAPSKAELAKVRDGSIVKVSIGGERFWVQVRKVKGSKVTGVIDNDLISTNEHGLSYGDKITFEKRHIHDIYKDVGGVTARWPGGPSMRGFAAEPPKLPPYYWVITKDRISDPGERSAVGVAAPRFKGITHEEIMARLKKAKVTWQKFRMLDDDGNIYYYGKLFERPGWDGDASFAPLDNFGMPNAGCTEIQYHESPPGGGPKEWRPL